MILLFYPATHHSKCLLFILHFAWKPQTIFFREVSITIQTPQITCGNQTPSKTLGLNQGHLDTVSLLSNDPMTSLETGTLTHAFLCPSLPTLRRPSEYYLQTNKTNHLPFLFLPCRKSRGNLVNVAIIEQESLPGPEEINFTCHTLRKDMN